MLLTERRRAREADERVPLPARIPASRFKDYVSDPRAVAGALRRPMPERPYRASRLGTLFHAWVEERYGAGAREEIDSLVGERDVDPEEAGAGRPNSEEEARLEQLKRTFERSRWAGLRPLEVEREIHLPFDGRTVVCKIDAVFQAGERYEVVDWKTGASPRGGADLEKRQFQLALYRLAYARWAHRDPRDIDAYFYFVADDLIVAPPHVDDEEELLALWRDAVG